MQITYIYHSCFTIELEKSVFVFDYFQGTLPKFPVNKHIFFFASHKHQDHFNMDIFRKFQPPYHVTYILSNDIRLNEKYLERYGYSASIKEQIVSVSKNNSYDITDEMQLQTLKSTDAGVAFLINAENKRIYHAGDLNWWHWENESKTFLLHQKQVYEEQIKKLCDMPIDVAFIPLDYRLGESAELGMMYFLMTVNVKTVFPMHLWEHYDLVEKCCTKGKLAEYKDKIYTIEKENESWIL